MTSIPVNAFSAPQIRQVLQKQKLMDKNKKLQEEGALLPNNNAQQINSTRKSAPDSLEIAHKADLSKQQNFLDTFKNIIPTIGRKDLLDRSLSCTEPRKEIQIEIKDFSFDDMSAKSPTSSSNDLSPTATTTVERKQRFRFLSGQW